MTSNRKNKEGDYTAFGCYMNFLGICNRIITPKFYLTNEKSIIDKIQKIFDGYDIYDIDCREIAEDGGVINCATYSIKRNLS